MNFIEIIYQSKKKVHANIVEFQLTYLIQLLARNTFYLEKIIAINFIMKIAELFI